MSKKYRYRCSSENAIIFETRSSDASPPSLCINEGSAIVAGTLCLIHDDTLESLTLESAGVIDFNNCTISELSHNSLSDIGSNTHTQIDNHLADSTIHFTQGSIVHQNISGAGTNTHAQIDSHLGDSTIHFTQGSIVHQNISGAGTNTHAQIDSHLASSSAHGVSGSLVGTADSQSLTNKILTSSTNDVIARGLWVNNGSTNLSSYTATTPTIGQIPVVGASNTLNFQYPLSWRGNWSNSTTYNINDIVYSGGGSWVCILGHLNQVPPNATYWNQLSSGSSGSGNKTLIASMNPINVQVTNLNFERVMAFTYQGSATVGSLTEFCFISYMDSNVTSYTIRCVDLTHPGNILFSEVFTNTTENIQSITSLVNIPTTKSLLEIQLKKSNGNKVYLSGITIYV